MQFKVHNLFTISSAYHSQLAWRTFCLRPFPLTLSWLKLSSGFGTIRYIALCSSNEWKLGEDKEGKRKGQRNKEGIGRGAVQEREEKENWIKTEKRKSHTCNRKEQKDTYDRLHKHIYNTYTKIMSTHTTEHIHLICPIPVTLKVHNWKHRKQR